MAKAKLVKANEKIAERVVSGYKKIEDGVVGGYKKIEDGVVGRFTRMTDKFVDEFLTKDGESVDVWRKKGRHGRRAAQEQAILPGENNKKEHKSRRTVKFRIPCRVMAFQSHKSCGIFLFAAVTK